MQYDGSITPLAAQTSRSNSISIAGKRSHEVIGVVRRGAGVWGEGCGVRVSREQCADQRITSYRDRVLSG